MNRSSSSTSLNTNPPIREVIRSIIEDECNLEGVNIDPYVKTLEDNLIFDANILLRIKPELLSKLPLPLLLESELATLIEEHKSLSKPKITVSTQSSRNLLTRSEHSNSVLHRSVKSSPEHSEDILEKQKLVLLGITPEMREKLLNCWNHLLSLKDGSLGRFFEEFYGIFLEKDKVGKKLFENRSMKSQAQSLMKIMKFIMSSVNEPLNLIEPLQRLGLSHIIYDVNRENYTAFAVSLAKTFENVLGPEVVTVDVKEAWYSMAMRLGEVMMAEYEGSRRGWKSSIYFKRGRGSFKLRGTLLTHKKLIIYKSPDSNKIIDEVYMNVIEDLDIIDEGQELDVEKPTPLCFSLNTGVYVYTFCTKTDEEFDKWVDEFTFRIRAYQRVGILAVDSSDSEDDEPKKKEKRKKKIVNKMKMAINEKKNRNKN